MIRPTGLKSPLEMPAFQTWLRPAWGAIEAEALGGPNLKIKRKPGHGES